MAAKQTWSKHILNKRPKWNSRRPVSGSTANDLFAVGTLAFAVSLLAFSYYFQKSEILLYGDTIAHINIARRVFDSQTPGLLQLGTVWLPLPHLLMIPFLVSDAMWQTGIGGSVPSMLAFVFGAVGIFRLTRILIASAALQSETKIGPWVAALVFVANPNVIYLQTTAMTESLCLAFFIWATAYLIEFLAGVTTFSAIPETANASNRSLWKCALCVAAAELTRYDGWMLAAGIGLAVVIAAISHRDDRTLRGAALKFVIAISIAPALWLAYNFAIYGNTLEFANGPYSARAIEQRTATPGVLGHPGTNDVILSARYFLKTAEMDMASGNWGRIWIAIAVAAFLILFLKKWKAALAAMILGVPILFYAVSIAYAGVPLFIPAWWPFTYYNVRYGVQLLPLFSVATGVLVASALGFAAAAPQPLLKNLRIGVAPALVLITVLSYISVWKTQPLCFTEGWVNSRTKFTLESAVSRTILGLPHTATYLMYLGDHVGAFEQAGIPLRQVMNEGNHRPWKRPKDPEGLWERALADPDRYVDFVIAFEGDPVDRSINKAKLSLISVIHTTGQPEARIYAARRKADANPQSSGGSAGNSVHLKAAALVMAGE